MAESVDAPDLKSVVSDDVWVRVPLPAPYARMAELADALDSKSSSKECGFESHFGHFGGETPLFHRTSFHVDTSLPNIVSPPFMLH